MSQWQLNFICQISFTHQAAKQHNRAAVWDKFDKFERFLTLLLSNFDVFGKSYIDHKSSEQMTWRASTRPQGPARIPQYYCTIGSHRSHKSGKNLRTSLDCERDYSFALIKYEQNRLFPSLSSPCLRLAPGCYSLKQRRNHRIFDTRGFWIHSYINVVTFTV